MNDLSTAFKADMKKNSGFILQLQQLKGLMRKRFLLFKARYALALITLVLPIFAQAIICYVLPVETETIDFIRQTVRTVGNYSFNVKNYKEFTMLYSVTNRSSNMFSTVFDNYYSSPGLLKLEKLDQNTSIPSFVKQKRKDSLKYLVSDYYTAFSFDSYDSSTVIANAYYSTMIYHSSATILNEITNIFLAFYNSNSSNIKKTITTFNTPIPRNDTSMFNDNNFLKYLSCIDILPLSTLNYINGVIFAIFISFFVVHVGKERINGSKHLQLLTGVHFSIYWIANFLFDFIICFYTICGTVGIIKLIDFVRNEPLSETFLIANEENLLYLFILLIFSSFAWLAYAYVFSNFFKSEIIGFIILMVILGMAAFMDMVWCFFQLFVRINVKDSNLNDTISDILEIIRWTFVILFPNVTIKRGLFDLKVRKNEFCVQAINNILKSKF